MKNKLDCRYRSNAENTVISSDKINIYYNIKEQTDQTKFRITLERFLPVKLAIANSRCLKVRP